MFAYIEGRVTVTETVTDTATATDTVPLCGRRRERETALDFFEVQENSKASLAKGRGTAAEGGGGGILSKESLYR